MMRYSGDFSAESLDAVAAESGINPAALQKHINSDQTTQLIEDNYRIALLLAFAARRLLSLTANSFAARLKEHGYCL